MFSTDTPKRWLQCKWVPVLCALLAFCRSAQAQNSNSDVERARDEFLAKFFVKCSDYIYYFGLKEAFTSDCPNVNRSNRVSDAREVTGCEELIAFDGFSLPHATGSKDPAGTLRITPLRTFGPDVEEKVLFVIDYASYASRKRVTDRLLSDQQRTSPYWAPWERPVINTNATKSDEVSNGGLASGTKAIGIGIKKRGQWTFAAGPDFPILAGPQSVERAGGVDLSQLWESILDPVRAAGPAADVPGVGASAMRGFEKIASCGKVPGEFATQPAPPRLPPPSAASAS